MPDITVDMIGTPESQDLPKHTVHITEDPNSDVWKRAQSLEEDIFMREERHYFPTVEAMRDHFGRYDDRTVIVSAEAETQGGIESIGLIRVELSPKPGEFDGNLTLPAIEDIKNGEIHAYDGVLEELMGLFGDGTLAEGGSIAKHPTAELAERLGVPVEIADKLKDQLNAELFMEIFGICDKHGIKTFLAETSYGYFTEILQPMFDGLGIIRQLGEPTIVDGAPMVLVAYDVEASKAAFFGQ